MKRIWIAWFMGLLVSAMTCGSVWAQATAQISGAVQDQSGAVLPGVEVTATQGEGPIVERCRLRANPRAAIWAHDRGTVTVRDCEGDGDLRADASSRLTSTGNRLTTPGGRRRK